MWETAIGAVASLATGGVTGVFGGILSKWLDQKEVRATAKQDAKTAVSIARIDADARVQAAAQGVDIAEYEAQRARYESEAAIAKTDGLALASAIEADKASYGSWVDYVRGMVRPILTGIHAYYFWLLLNGVALMSVSSWTPEQQFSLSYEIIGNVMNLGNIVVGFWFGSRTVRAKV